jgi:cardiolipin synthase
MPDPTSVEWLWPWIALGITVAGLVVALLAVSHVVLNKRDVRAAIGWSGLIVSNPLLGGLAYYVLGINRIRRRAARMATRRRVERADAAARRDSRAVVERLPENVRRLEQMVRGITHTPLTVGNAVLPLINGDQGFPAMLEAIRGAERSVVLASYIFDHDRAGAMFLGALREAVERGVEVRVLIDGAGALYSRPRMTRALREHGIRTAEFLPRRIPLRNAYMNLRNHRKILVVDRKIAFTGGLNVREGCLLEASPRHPVQDLHFRIEGPVVDQMFEAIAEDWYFTTREQLVGPAWASAVAPVGDVAARGIADGPDEDFENLHWTILSALATAQRSVRIATPYFLPEAPTITALRLAAMRGLEVDILLPEVNNLRIVQWACMAQLWQVLEAGCRIWLTPAPFDHSKVMVVDDVWSLVGSANWDPRSLRLNFEYDIECYDERLAAELLELTAGKMDDSRRLSMGDVDARNLPVRVRDGLARLLLPYL